MEFFGSDARGGPCGGRLSAGRAKLSEFGAGAFGTSAPCQGTKSRPEATYGSGDTKLHWFFKMAAAPALKRPFLVGFSNFFFWIPGPGGDPRRFPRPFGGFQDGHRARAKTAKTAIPGGIFKLFFFDSHV